MVSKNKSRDIDMLHGPIWNKIPLFALPVAATAILGQLFNAADLIVVGNFSGEHSTAAVAAVGANSPIIGLLVNLFIGLALGANVVIAHAVGRGDGVGVRKAVHTAVALSLLGGVVFGIFGEIISTPLLSLLNVPDDVLPLAVLYLRIYLAGLPVILLYNFEAAIFRSIGETKTPLVVLALSGVLNVILNLFFVIVLGMTVSGVAIATVVSNAASAAALYIKLRRAKGDVRIDPKQIRIDLGSFKKILRIGLPAGIQSAVFSVANIVVQSAINSLGTVVMAASSAAYNIEIITYDILNSFSQACTTFVGQNYGAREYSRCKRTLFICLAEGIVALTVGIVLILSIGKTLLSFFDPNPEVIETGYVRLVTLMLAHYACLLYEVMSGYMRGFGISVAPAVLAMTGVCGIRLVWIKFVFPLYDTFGSIMAVYPISLSATAVFIGIALLCLRPAHDRMMRDSVHD